MIKENDTVREKKTGAIGTVRHVQNGSGKEEHGIVVVFITDPGNNKYLTKGDVEHYPHHGWKSWLTIVNN